LELIKQRHFLCGRNSLYQLEIDNNLSGKMARRVDPLDVSFDEYRAIFGDSDEEDEFSARSGIVVDVGADPKADDFFTFMFGEDLFDKIVEETNRYAHQMLTDNERLGRWRDVTKAEVKAYFGMCVIMGMNILPKVADYWATRE